jgi:hypothetical protein
VLVTALVVRGAAETVDGRFDADRREVWEPGLCMRAPFRAVLTGAAS